MQLELSKNKLNGEIVKMTYTHPYNNYPKILSKRTGPNIAISETGMHRGVLYNGRVHCVNYPEGLPEQQWLSSFYSELGSTRSIQRIPF